MTQPSRIGVVVLAVLGVVLGICQPAQAAVPSDGGSQTYLQDTASGGMTSTFTADDTNTGRYASTKKVPVVIIGDGCAATSNSDLSGKALTPSCVDLGGGSGDSSLETAVAGIAVAAYNNGGIAGVCRDCTFMTIKTDTNSSTGIKNAVIEAVSRIKAAHGDPSTKAQGVLLILYDHNLGYDSANPADEDLRRLLNNILTQATGPYVDASNTAITVVAPAGNGEPLPNGGRYQTDVPSYPCAHTSDPLADPNDPEARLKLVLCVGSVDTATATKNKRSVFSNSGGWIDVSAPGQGVYATGGGLVDDTAAAAAIVAGAAARLHAITYATVYNMPWDIQQFLIRSGFSQVGPFAIDPTTDPLTINDLTATQAAVQAITQGTPLASSRTGTPGVWLARFWNSVFGIPDAWATHFPGHGGGVVQTVAKLSEPVDGFLVVPLNQIKNRWQFDVKGQAIGQPGTTFTLELLRHDCPSLAACNYNDPINAYNPTGTPVAMLVPSRAATFSSASSILAKIRNSYVLGPTGTTPTGAPGTDSWAEGEYSIRLTVQRPGTTAISQRRIFVDKSADPSFNESIGAGAPIVLNDVVNAGPNVGNIIEDGSGPYGPYLEVVVGSSHGTVGKRVYVIDHTGVQRFRSDQLAGPIMSTPTVGDVIPGNGTLEIVVTADVASQPNLYVFAPPNTSPALTPIALPLGSKSSPSVGKASPTSDDRDSIFVTTKGNLLHWYKYESGSSLTMKDTARLTCESAQNVDPLTDPNNSNYYGNMGRGPCAQANVMESKPLVANLRGMSNGAPPVRVFVASQDPLTTYGYDPQYGSSPAKLKLLPGFPLPWSSGFHPGGNFDVSAAYADNDGELELFDVEYDPAGNQSRVIKLEVQGATTTAATNARVDKRSGTTLDAVSDWVPGELFMYGGAAEGDVIGGDSGRYETVVVGQTGTVYLYDSGATRKASAKMAGRGAGTPLIADIDNDGQVEILTTSDDRFLYAWNYDGTTALKLKRSLASGRYGFPRALKSKPCFQPFPVASPLPSWPTSSVLRCTAPVLADIDGDGHVELIAVAGTGALETNALYVWDFAASDTLATLPSDAGWLKKAFAWLFGDETLSAAGVSAPIINKAGECETPGCMAKTNSATISGTVRNSSGSAFGGATVEISWDSGGIVTLANSTDGAGYFMFDQVNPGMTYKLTVSASGYTSQSVPVSPTQENPDDVVNFTLQSSGISRPELLTFPYPDAGGDAQVRGADILAVVRCFNKHAVVANAWNPAYWDGPLTNATGPTACRFRDMNADGWLTGNDILVVVRWYTKEIGSPEDMRLTVPVGYSLKSQFFIVRAEANAAGQLPDSITYNCTKGGVPGTSCGPNELIFPADPADSANPNSPGRGFKPITLSTGTDSRAWTNGLLYWQSNSGGAGDYVLTFTAHYPNGDTASRQLRISVP